MSKIDSWITKIPRLKNSKVARFSYKAEAYANDDIEGVENFDYSRDMNVPLATHTDFDSSMLSIGARANFSSIPKNGLNHFFGRVSYNLNKVIDFLSDLLDDFRVQGVETIRKSTNFTLGTYYDGKKIRIANTHATNTITCTLPSGQKMNGNGTISIPAGRIIDIELVGATWKDSLTGDLVGNADTATAIKPLGNSITLPATSTSVTKIIKIATISPHYAGSISIYTVGASLGDGLTMYINGGHANPSGLKVMYGKHNITYGVKKIIVTHVPGLDDSTRNIYAEIVTVANRDSTTTLGIVETIRGTFTPSMTEVPSVEGTVLDSLPLDYTRGDISSYQHKFTKNIIGNLTGNVTGNITGDLIGNADTATKPLYQWKETVLYSSSTSFFWFKVCKITTAMTFDLELISDNNYAYRASYRLSVSRYPLNSAYTVALFNLGQTAATQAKLAVALDADGYLYIQTNCLWTSSLFVTLLYSDSDFSITMDKLGHAPFGTESGFTPVKIITQTGGFRVAGGVVDNEASPVINTNIIGNVTGNADTATKLANARTITIAGDATGSTTFDGSANKTLTLSVTKAATADKWKTARNIRISDADGTNTGSAVSVDGSENETLKLPATIKANISGNADTATNASKANVRVSLRHGDTWFAKTWTGLTNFYGIHIWTDGDNIYYSQDSHHVLNKATSTWTAKTWNGLTNFYGEYIWTDGENIYHSDGTNQLVLNKATSTWTAKTWNGLTNFYGEYIWTDGENIYYNRRTNNYVLNKATSTWTVKSWTGLTDLTDFNGSEIWTDGENIYYSSGTSQYVLNKATSTWAAKTWNGLTNFTGRYIWTDGDNIYYSYETKQYVLNKATSAWVAKTWNGLTKFNGDHIWTDGESIYYSYGTTRYVLPATRHNYIDEDKYNSLFGTVTNCNCSTLSARFVFGNE